jgi:hypothetical protein
MYLQADKPLFPLPLVHDGGYGGTPPEELSARPQSPAKRPRRKKRLPKPPVHLYQFSIFPISSTFSLGMKKCRTP